MKGLYFQSALYILTVTFIAHTVSAVPQTKDSSTGNAGKASASDARDEVSSAEVNAAEGSSQETDGIFSEQEREQGLDPFMSEKKKRADEYFRRGVLLYEGKDYANAAEAFQIAYDTLPHPAVLGNIAMCYDRAGKVPEAVTYYRLYLKDPVISTRNSTMQARLDELSTLVSSLRISCNRNCEIRVDGINRGVSKTEVVVMPGQHRVEGVTENSVAASEMLQVQAREEKDVELQIPLPTPPVPPVIFVTPAQDTPPIPVAEPPLFSGGFWFAGGMTVVSVSLVTAFGTMTLSQKEDYRASEWTDKDAKDRGERYRTVTNAMIGLSGASAAAAVLFAVSDINRRHKKNRVAVESASTMGAGIAISF
jgi:hypothetical protein